MLPQAQWLEVIERAPLVSIDLILRDEAGQVLLGLRRNAPARGAWFVPGGAIRKGETLDEAFERIARAELGLALRRADARLLGVYEHFYEHNFAGVPGIATHYVVLAHALELKTFPRTPGDAQHEALRAFSVAALLADPKVHRYTKAYFPHSD